MGGNAWAITMILRRSELRGAGFTVLKGRFLERFFGEFGNSGEQAWRKIGLPFDGLATQSMEGVKAGLFGSQRLL